MRSDVLAAEFGPDFVFESKGRVTEYGYEVEVRIPFKSIRFQLDTPEFSHFSGNIFFLWGHDENFFEWASAKITWLDLTLDWRPTPKLRVNGRYQLQWVGRRTDGSTVDLWRSPRLKVEYQLSRPIFLRLVGEYTTERRDARSVIDRSAVIFSSPTNRTRARCCLPAMAARSGTPPSWAVQVFAGRRTVSSSS